MEFLVTDFVKLILIFLRVIGALISAPIYSNQAIPVTTRVVFAAVISYILFYVLPVPPELFNINLSQLALYGIKEVITGLLLGFTVQIIFYAISYAGSFIGFDIGLMMAQVMNPMDETNSNVIGQLINVLSIFIFFLIDGHHYIIRGLGLSFNIIPLGTYTVTEGVYDLLIKFSASVFIIAVKLAAPFLVSYMLIHIGEGIVARVIPQMQVFFVTQPIKLAVGFILLSLTTPMYLYVIKNLLNEFENNLYLLVQAMI